MQQIGVKITRQENASHYGMAVGDVVRVPLEDYVAGVVASEVGNAAIEAARAQAVAARTFAWPYYHKGLTITDASSKHQAFRAPRINEQRYPRAVQAAQDTAGQLLRYHGAVIGTCSYSASNGGHTVSSAERWGGARAWLISQDDPWDAAAGGARTGHGVGMSQRGAKYAASIGVSYREILAFYYPGTEIWTEEGEGMNEKATKVVESARSQLGGPYVFGAWGDSCTPSLRKKYAGYNPDHKEAIYKKCQVLNGSGRSCDGCKWQGSLAFDCRGFVHWCFLQVGIAISGGGATSQYNTASNWMERGKIQDMPDLVCAVYKYQDGKMIHTGVHVGGGQIIHCSAGVQTGKTTDRGWTHYAIPVGLYTTAELKAAGRGTIMPTIKRGASGEAVKQLQTALKRLGYYDEGEVDGAFGALTADSVRRFQADNGLGVDAICGPATWAAIHEALNALEINQEGPQDESEGETEEEPTHKPAGDPEPAWAALVQQMREISAEQSRLQMQMGALVEAAETMLQAGA